MKHANRLMAATLLADDEYPGYVLIHPYPGLYIPATREGLQVAPLPAMGETGLSYWFGSEASAWEFVAGVVSSPVGEARHAEA